MEHFSVLLQESIEHLNIKPDGLYIDGTLGRGGHSLEIVKKLSKNGHLYCFDKDIQAIEESKHRLKDYLEQITFFHTDFSNMEKVLREHGVQHVDGIMLDIGVSSPQFDDETRGFSYRFDARLDMRMDQNQSLSAYEVVNEYDYHDLVRILYRYGEESFAKAIARKIEQARELKSITTTFELVEIIKSALPMKVLNKKGHPAKKSFQALRIEVNQELSALEKGLVAATSLLNSKGRLAVISFHSLEDRIVKDYFNQLGKTPKVDKHIPIMPDAVAETPYNLITRKPIVADEQENNINKRSHSAKLRVLEKK